MDSELERLLAEAMKLPPAARSDLASALIHSLDTEVDDGVEAAWSAEIARRIRDLDEGRVQGISWEEARRIIRGG